MPLPDNYSGVDVGRVTRGAARSMLAKVMLTRGDFQTAATLAEEVIDGGTVRTATQL